MRDIYIAIGAIIFYTIIMPIIDSISGIIQSAINLKINKWQMNMQIAESQAQEIINQNNKTQAIGFDIPADSIED